MRVVFSCATFGGYTIEIASSDHNARWAHVSSELASLDGNYVPSGDHRIASEGDPERSGEWLINFSITKLKEFLRNNNLFNLVELVNTINYHIHTDYDPAIDEQVVYICSH